MPLINFLDDRDRYFYRKATYADLDRFLIWIAKLSWAQFKIIRFEQ